MSLKLYSTTIRKSGDAFVKKEFKFQSESIKGQRESIVTGQSWVYALNTHYSLESLVLCLVKNIFKGPTESALV